MQAITNTDTYAEAVSQDYLTSVSALTPRLSQSQELAIYQEMQQLARQKLLVFTQSITHVALLEHLIERIEAKAAKTNKLTYLIQHKSYHSILHLLDEIKVLSFLGDELTLKRRTKKLQRHLFEWPLPRYIVINAANEVIAALELDKTRNKANKIKRCIKEKTQHYCRLRNRLTTANLGLVHSVSNRFRFLGLGYDDLVQEGSVGLMKAVERFDPLKGFLFSTYAHLVISQQIHLALDQQSSLVRRPYNQLREKAIVDKTRAKLEQRLLRAPRGSEFSESLPNSLGDKVPHIAINIQPTADNEAFHVQPNNPELYENKEISQQEMDTRLLVNKRHVESAMKKLNQRSLQILRMRFGIGINRTYTLKEIGETFGMSTERARQIANQAVKDLAQLLNDEAASTTPL